MAFASPTDTTHTERFDHDNADFFFKRPCLGRIPRQGRDSLGIVSSSETRKGWPLLVVENEVNGDAESREFK